MTGLSSSSWRSGVAVLAFHSATCGERPLPTPRTVAIARDADEAHAALFRRLHGQALRAAPDTRVSCIVTENGTQPSTRLLHLLSGQDLGITQASRCVTREGRVVDAISGRKAVVLSVRSFAMTEPGKAEAFGMYGLGVFWCGGGTYSLEFRLGRWEVTDPASPIEC